MYARVLSQGRRLRHRQHRVDGREFGVQVGCRCFDCTSDRRRFRGSIFVDLERIFCKRVL
jgi:hypothetical protein